MTTEQMDQFSEFAWRAWSSKLGEIKKIAKMLQDGTPLGDEQRQIASGVMTLAAAEMHKRLADMAGGET